MNPSNEREEFPEDFRRCVEFHGHLCPGLAIGYSAVRAARTVLSGDRAPDEEIVAVVENDSCSVDAVQVLLGCTFGKGNLVFRDWGKQVFTIMDRNTQKAVRVSFTGPTPFREERHRLKKLIESGQATEADREKWSDLRHRAILKLVSCNPHEFFDIREVPAQLPPKAQTVTTVPCEVCGEATVRQRMIESHGKLMCAECAVSA